MAILDRFRKTPDDKLAPKMAQAAGDVLEELMNFGLPAHLGSGWTHEPPAVLHHYTTLHGFMGILSTNRIWATNARYLNDVNDSRQLWAAVLEGLNALLQAGKTFPGYDLHELSRIVRARRDDDSFVASFSESRDSLSQWRAYSGGGPGVCLCFAGKALNTQWVYNNATDSHWTASQFSKVKYLSTEGPELTSSLEELLSGPRSPLMAASDSYTTKQFSREEETVILLSLFHARFKDPAFAEEREWRLSFRRYQGKPMRHQRFRVVRSLLVPYIEAELNKGMKSEALVEGDFVREVIIGPSAHSDLTADAAKQFLFNLGRPDIPVTVSEMPYRDW